MSSNARVVSQPGLNDPAETIVLVAPSDDVWEEMASHAWNDETLDFFLSELDNHPGLWDTFSLLYSASVRSDKWLRKQTDPNATLVFVLRAIYEWTFKERIATEQVSTLAVQRRLWQHYSFSQMPAIAWRHIHLNPGVGDEILELLWHRNLRINQPVDCPLKKAKRPGFHPSSTSLVTALMANENLTDKQVFKWLVRMANKNAPHADSRMLSAIVGSVIDNPNVSRRTLRTALRICLRAVPDEDAAEYGHYYQITRRLIFDAIGHPKMDYSILDGLRDAGLINRVDYEGYVDEFAISTPAEPEPEFVHPEAGSTFELDRQYVDDFLRSGDLRLTEPKLLGVVPEGFPLPDEVWEEVATKLESHKNPASVDGFRSTSQRLDRVNNMITQRPSPPSKVLLRSLRATMPVEPVSAMLYHYGYAAVKLREQAIADGFDAEHLPLEWILEIYS